MPVTDILGIKVQNIKSILHAVRFENCITKKEISEITGLSFATVSNLCNELIDMDLLSTAKNQALSVGRTPQTLTLNYNHYCVLCINLQLRGAMEIAVMNFRNEIVTQRTYHINLDWQAEDMIRFARERYQADILPEVAQDAAIIGVGVAVSSIFDIHTSRLICCAIPQLENVDMKTLVETEFGIRAYIDNEANLCACAIQAQSKNCENAVYIHASEGVGVGIISRGSLLQGSNGYAGEVAHMPIGSSDVRCKTCGCYGCIENDLCIDGILTRYLGEEPSDRFSQWEAFVKALHDGEHRAKEVAAQCGRLLGRLISVLVNLFDPEEVFVGGDIAKIHRYVERSTQEEYDLRRGAWRRNVPQITWDDNSELRIMIGISEKISSDWSPT